MCVGVYMCVFVCVCIYLFVSFLTHMRFARVCVHVVENANLYHFLWTHLLLCCLDVAGGPSGSKNQDPATFLWG